jgi:hypothetical protein
MPFQHRAMRFFFQLENAYHSLLFFLAWLNDLAILSYAIRSHSWQLGARTNELSVMVGTGCDLTAMRSCLSAIPREPTTYKRFLPHVSPASLSIPGRLVVVRFVSRIH